MAIPRHPAPGHSRPVALPDWGVDLGIDGGILVEDSAIAPGEGPEWERCDWVLAAWLHLTGAAERSQEDAAGPIGSYAFRLKEYDGRRYDRAWVNRIFLFLRRWAARQAGMTEEALLGPMPSPEIVLTHDVDAVRKTAEIRLKQSAFHALNATRAAANGKFKDAAGLIGRSMQFALRPADFQTLGEVRRLEEAAGLRSILHFYGGPPGLRRGSLSRILIDPAYDIMSPDLVSELARLREGGWTIGLHQSFNSWTDADPMRSERKRVEEASGTRIIHCRQHWLRFSWKDTWRAQDAAGLSHDSTLGFNDRPGFRNGAALAIHPWDFTFERPLALSAQPMAFMDSHFYDYAMMSEDERVEAMGHWIEEIRSVAGQATVNWHTHTITNAYGWGTGYRELLRLMAK
jgi:hypothetical protein